MFFNGLIFILFSKLLIAIPSYHSEWVKFFINRGPFPAIFFTIAITAKKITTRLRLSCRLPHQPGLPLYFSFQGSLKRRNRPVNNQTSGGACYSRIDDFPSQQPMR